MLGPRGRKVWVRQYAPATGSVTCTFPATPLPNSIIVLIGTSNAAGTGNIEGSGGGANWARIACGRYDTHGNSSGIAQCEAGLYLGYVGDAPSTSVTVSGLASFPITAAAELVGLGPTLGGSSFHLTHGVSVQGAVPSGDLVLPELADIEGGVVVWAFCDRGDGSPGVLRSDSTVPQVLAGSLAASPTVTMRMGLAVRRGAQRDKIAFTGSINNAVACAAIIRPA